MALNVIKISRIRPATDSSRDSVESLVIPLTFFDLRWVRSHPTQKVIFYKLSGPESSRECFHAVILPKLQLSLSLVLRHYIPLAGRLTWWAPEDPKPRIVVSDESTVSLVVAETDADFSGVSGKGLRHQSELRVLVPELSISRDSATLISLQITLFPTKGFSIGTSEHHVVQDATGSSMFIKSWAHICKSQEIGTMTLPEELSPVIDRTIVEVPANLESKILESQSYFSDEINGKRTLNMPPIGKIGSDFVRFTLQLTQEHIVKLKERVNSESTRRDLHLSTFVVANAYMWSCMVKARGGDAERPVVFMYAADFRNRLNRSVPENYFGNCVFPIGCFGYEAKTFLGEDGFVNAVEILSGSVKSLGSRGIESLCDMYIDGMESMKIGTQVESVSGSNWIGIYESDFGWGRPVNNEMVSIDRYTAFTMSKRRDETGGVEIGLCLTKTEMDIFISLFKNDF
ncbi:unnamed protein product [Microthlaspi erraticum]|uniref:Uncharacterized protein n=1 Tax=Microthlaspi erraticum TaxID=1685480 RepID=A0A6D2J132_9BRAS|nr:unnamed protein product [Microthlaspi erraticum]CAA7030895.1 unnamed protein product [Microthlaspi erraticum]